MQKTIIVIIALFSMVVPGTIFSQTPDPLNFYPHHLGDIADYARYEQGFPGDTLRNEVIQDSLGADGKYYIRYTQVGLVTVDTTALEVWGSIVGIDSVLLYKLDADSGDIWIGYRNSVGAVRVKVLDVVQSTIFGVLRTVKFFHYSDSAFGLWLGTHYLADGLGKIREDSDLAIPDLVMIGAVIDGVQYGTITGIDPEHEVSGLLYAELHSSYPNPFNPTTVVPFNIHRSGHYVLAIHDALGRKIKILVDSFLQPGDYEQVFDGEGLPSGQYFYRLSGDNINTVKIMTLAK